MSKTIQSAVEGLRAEEATLGNEVKRIETELAQAKSALKQVQAALAALGETPKVLRSAKKKASVSAKEVADFLARHVADGPRRIEDLKATISEHIAASGKSRTGFHRAFESALADKRFLVVEEQVRLRDEASTESRS